MVVDMYTFRLNNLNKVVESFGANTMCNHCASARDLVIGTLVKVTSYQRSLAIRGDDSRHKIVLRFTTSKQQSAERFRVSLQFLFW